MYLHGIQCAQSSVHYKQDSQKKLQIITNERNSSDLESNLEHFKTQSTIFFHF